MTSKPPRKPARKVASRKKAGSGKLLRLAFENPDRETGMVWCAIMRGGEVTRVDGGLEDCCWNGKKGWPVRLPEEDLIPVFQDWEAPVERGDGA